MSKPFFTAVLALSLVGAAAAQDDQPAPQIAQPQHKADYARAYYHSFKGDPEIGDEFLFHGLNPRECALFEPAGLRISLPAGHPDKRPGTGLTISTPVQGDFEITLGYEIIEEPKFNSQNATGLFVWVDLNLPGLNRGFILRGARQGKQYVAWYHLTPEAAKPVDRLLSFPAKDVRGRLRLVRTGSVLYHYAAEGTSDEFTLLTQHEFGAADLNAIRWGGTTGGPNAALEGRFLDIRIRADGLPELAGAVPGQGAAERILPQPNPGQDGGQPALRTDWLVLALGAGLALLMVCVAGLGLFVVLRARRTPAASTAAPPETETPPTHVSFACANCGKLLKVRATLAGKAVKCPHCGEAAQMPRADAKEA